MPTRFIALYLLIILIWSDRSTNAGRWGRKNRISNPISVCIPCENLRKRNDTNNSVLDLFRHTYRKRKVELCCAQNANQGDTLIKLVSDRGRTRDKLPKLLCWEYRKQKLACTRYNRRKLRHLLKRLK